MEGLRYEQKEQPNDEQKEDSNEEQKDDGIEALAVQKWSRIKLKNCGVTGDKNVFVQVESYSKYDDIIPVSTMLEGTIDIVPNTVK